VSRVIVSVPGTPEPEPVPEPVTKQTGKKESSNG